MLIASKIMEEINRLKVQIAMMFDNNEGFLSYKTNLRHGDTHR